MAWEFELVDTVAASVDSVFFSPINDLSLARGKENYIRDMSASYYIKTYRSFVLRYYRLVRTCIFSGARSSLNQRIAYIAKRFRSKRGIVDLVLILIEKKEKADIGVWCEINSILLHMCCWYLQCYLCRSQSTQHYGYWRSRWPLVHTYSWEEAWMIWSITTT